MELTMLIAHLSILFLSMTGTSTRACIRLSQCRVIRTV
jgi:hypothetical protein